MSCASLRASLVPPAPFLPTSPSAFWLTSRLSRREQWDVGCAHGEADGGGHSKQNAHSKPACGTCSNGPARLMPGKGTSLQCRMKVITAFGRIQISPHPAPFLQRVPADSWDFPSIVNRSQGFSLAAKQKFTPIKSTRDRHTEDIKGDSSLGDGMEHRSRK